MPTSATCSLMPVHGDPQNIFTSISQFCLQTSWRGKKIQKTSHLSRSISHTPGHVLIRATETRISQFKAPSLNKAKAWELKAWEPAQVPACKQPQGSIFQAEILTATSQEPEMPPHLACPAAGAWKASLLGPLSTSHWGGGFCTSPVRVLAAPALCSRAPGTQTVPGCFAVSLGNFYSESSSQQWRGTSREGGKGHYSNRADSFICACSTRGLQPSLSRALVSLRHAETTRHEAQTAALRAAS